MQKSINFIPIDYDYFDWQGRNYAKICGRIDDGKRACIIDSCDVFFWAILAPKTSEKTIKEIQGKIQKIKIQKGSRTSTVLKTEIHNKNFLGKLVRAIKIFVTNLKDAHSIADKIGMKEVIARREYDLNFTTKYILERGLKPLTWYKIDGELLNNSEEFGGIDNSIDVDICLKVEKIEQLPKQPKFLPRILAYDIETDEFEIGKGEILMISLVGEDFKKVLTWKKSSSEKYVESFKDETEMLEKFVEHVKSYSPDVLAGYFSDGFDLPYLRARAEKLGIKLTLGLDNSQPKFTRGRMTTGKINGIIHIDLLRFIQTAYSQYMQSETLSLDEVASELLGERKLAFDHQHSSKIDHQGWEKYFAYNLQDSLLTYKLMQKAWPDLIEFTKIVQEPLFNVSRAGMSTHVGNYIIHNLEKFNEIAEKRPVHDEISKRMLRPKYEGAFVLQPKPGLYENICFFDFTSMYASVIVTYNLSLSTSTKQKTNSYAGELNKKKVYFIKQPGFFPQMLKEIINKRKQYKKEYSKNPNPFSKARSNAYKLLANSSYGYQGFFGARYYCVEAASSTAYFARKHIKSAIEKIKKAGFTLVYSDTDSICFQLKKKTKKQALALLSKINKTLPGIMELDLEDFYKRGIWVTKRTGEFGAKKKYALINNKNKIKIRGFETVRRDWCQLARQTQNKVLQLILTTGNEKKALQYLKQIIKKLKNREIPLQQLIIRTQLKKPLDEYKSESPHVTIAKRMKEMELPVDIGMLIEYYISEPKEKKKKFLVRERAKMLDEKGKYDINYYLKKQILPAVENIFEVFNINTNEIVEGKKQKKLGDF